MLNSITSNVWKNKPCRGSFVEDYASQICGVMVLWQDLDEIHVTNLSEMLLGIECSDLDS